MENIINLLKENSNLYDEKLKIMSKDIRKYEKSYKKICINNKKHNDKLLSDILYDTELFRDIMSFIEEDTSVAMNTFLKSKEAYVKHIEKTDKNLSMAGLSRQILYSDLFINNLRILSIKNPSKKVLYEKILNMKKNEEELFLINKEMTNYVFNIFINNYEYLINEKEELKQSFKRCNWIIDKIKKKERISPIELAFLNELILESKDDNLYIELKNYLESLNNKEEIKVEVKKIENYSNKDNYEDEIIDKEEKEDDYIINNYAYSLSLFNTYKEVEEFLNSLIDKYDFNIFIIKLLKKIENKKIVEYIKEYVSKINKEEDNNLVSDENIILYNGFMKNKNIILDDISKITKDYYDDINKGLELIKQGTNKSEFIMKVPKVKKLRVNDIRIAYKRLSYNVYIILGIYCKKTNLGNNIIESIIRRNKDLKNIENSIINGFNIENIKIGMLNANDNLSEQINQKINAQIKK